MGLGVAGLGCSWGQRDTLRGSLGLCLIHWVTPRPFPGGEEGSRLPCSCMVGWDVILGRTSWRRSVSTPE